MCVCVCVVRACVDGECRWNINDSLLTRLVRVENFCSWLRQRMYFLRRLKPHGVNSKLMFLFHQMVLEGLISYSTQVWYGNLSAQLKPKVACLIWNEDHRGKRTSQSSVFVRNNLCLGRHRRFRMTQHTSWTQSCCPQADGSRWLNYWLKNSFIPFSTNTLNSRSTIWSFFFKELTCLACDAVAWSPLKYNLPYLWTSHNIYSHVRNYTRPPHPTPIVAFLRSFSMTPLYQWHLVLFLSPWFPRGRDNAA